ncbi:outer membrane protein assembly factor BamA [Rhodospirillaceae bacterium SYSU D60014]|uniref:outer membrane protein assembly factor BamA n=1 Tax=Virgifigura deserti TaxID=2268457 RepID=UPI000E664F59
MRVAAQEIFTGEPIAAIQIEGTQRIEPETVRSYMQLNVGDPFEADRIDRALKSLFATGLFADVTFRREGDTLMVQVVENPIINRLAFEGNDRIDDGTLETEVQLRPRVVFTQTRVQNDARRILEIYRRSGRFAATVEPKVIPLDQNRVDLVFEIDEGPVTSVERIDFVGNRAFSDSELRDEILTQESAWYRPFSTTDTYDPDRLTVDREALRDFYLEEGYADFRVVSAVAELSPDRQSFFITFTVEEGERYRFGEVDIETTLRNLDPETLRDDITTESDDWYDAGEVEESMAALTDRVGTLGYAFVDVRPRLERDRENRVIDLTYEIQEGPRVFIERIDISGNVRTLDKVIRREFRLVEGDAFNTAKLRRTRQRIQNLGFFRTVNIRNVPSDRPDRTTVEVEVEEQSTGELTFGIGFSTTEGPLGDIGLRERNLLGTGKDLRLNLTISGRRSQVDLSFTDPYFLDREIAAGFDLFRTEIDRRESSYDEKNLGGGVRAGYEVSEFLRQTLRYTLSENEITDVQDDASLAIKQQEGATISSVVGQELVYDRRNSRFDPTEGYFVRLRNDFAGVGGDVSYLRNRLSAGYYLPVWEDLVASVSGEVGYIFGIDDDVRVNDAFFLGGNNFRGFSTGGIGPRDLNTDDALGGNKFAIGTVDLSFPLGLPEEYQIRGRLFSDFGTLFDTDADVPGIADKSSVRASVGAGITWRSPLGPIAIDFAIPIAEEDFDERELFRFSLGTRF